MALRKQHECLNIAMYISAFFSSMYYSLLTNLLII